AEEDEHAADRGPGAAAVLLHDVLAHGQPRHGGERDPAERREVELPLLRLGELAVQAAADLVAAAPAGLADEDPARARRPEADDAAPAHADVEDAVVLDLDVGERPGRDDPAPAAVVAVAGIDDDHAPRPARIARVVDAPAADRPV